LDVLRGGPILLIVNPAARRAKRLESIACAAFRDEGIACEVVHTDASGHARAIATEHAVAQTAVFTLGGDGTSMEVMEALAHTEIPIGILPGGTGNLVARALGTPLRIDRAVHALVHGTMTDIDLGAVNGRSFAFSTGIGVDARMVRETAPTVKRRFGVAGYAMTATRAVFSTEPFHVRAEVDGEVLETESISVFVANFGAVLGNLLLLGPGITHDDGQLDLCVFSPTGAIGALNVAWRLLRKDFSADPAMLYRRGREIRIECTPPQVYQADGEVLGTTPLVARADPMAARLLVRARD
jgi:YegS/Rv2252/BmrU family lipid kinase